MIKLDGPFRGKATLGDGLRVANIELDQRLAVALTSLPMPADGLLHDDDLFYALLRLNPTFAKDLDLGKIPDQRWLEAISRSGASVIAVDVSLTRVQDNLAYVLNDAFKNRVDPYSLGTNDFIAAVARQALAHRDSHSRRPTTADALACLFGSGRMEPLSNVPQALAVLSKLTQASIGESDFQYLLGLEGGRIVFRVASVLDDYVQRTESGLLVPQRAILTHFKDQFGVFTVDEIEELEELLNDDAATEFQFQLFFERHTHFFRQWDYREVHAQVHLRRHDQGDLIPDFILTDREAQKATIVELKLPRAKLIRRQRNRDRFSSGLLEARSQLLNYKRWFQEQQNRKSLQEQIGLEIYEPHLSVIIGRSTEFSDCLNRQVLRSEHPDIEIVTYDDILRYAGQRRMHIRTV